MPYESTDKGSDAFGMIGAIGGIGGEGFLNGGDLQSSVKGGLRSGMNLANGIAAVAKGVGSASAVAGPIGAAASFALETCITFYEASGDLGKANSKIAALEALSTAAYPDLEKIRLWLINKLGRRANYDHAETGGAHLMKANVSGAWSSGTRAGKAGAAAGTVGMVVATPITTVFGQLGANLTRAGRGVLKASGAMESKRKGFAGTLMLLQKETANGAATAKAQMAQKMIQIILSEGLANSNAARQMQDEIDKIMRGAIEKGMSSFKS